MGETGRPGRILRRAGKDTREVRDVLLSARERASFAAHLREPGRLTVRQQHVLLLLVLLGFVAVWASGTLLVEAWAPASRAAWDAAWILALVSFLAAIAVPLPGATTGVLLALRHDPTLLAWGIGGAAAGGTVGAAVVFYVGGALRRSLERRAHRSAWARRVVAWGEHVARHRSYPGIAALLSVPLVPRPPVLYLGSVLNLRLLPFLAAVFVGMVVRTSIVAWGAQLADAFL
ncbi:MAG TPA: hypothetical protein VGR28_13425 [Candidatus Thermoplasmatota archaeon]|jgi:uncharacterized membrane protein YdjX (TVP38/TMEM64 family)|nr:hypothetical protein [Candidatus Thermoplasmatota archaeon]